MNPNYWPLKLHLKSNRLQVFLLTQFRPPRLIQWNELKDWLWFTLCAGCATSNTPWPAPHFPSLSSSSIAPPPQSFSAFLQTKDKRGRWRWGPCELRAPWDKVRPLLTRPRPSPHILPPTSIDYVVGGREAGLIISFSPAPLSSSSSSCSNPPSSPPPWFEQRHRRPCLILSPPLPNDIFAINGRLSGLSIIRPWQNQWRWCRPMGHFLQKHSFNVGSPTSRR